MNLACLLLSFVVLILFCAFCYQKRKLRYWKCRKVPSLKPEFLHGNARGVGRKIHVGEFIARMYLQLKPMGPIGGIYIYSRTVAIPTNLDLIKSLMTKDFNIFTNRGNYFNETDEPLSAHLINIEDEQWHQLRQKLSPTFTSSKLKLVVSIISGIADKLVATIHKEAGQVEVKDVAARFATDVIASVAFGIESNSLQDKSSHFYQIGLKAFMSFNFIKRAFMMSHRKLARRLHMVSRSKEIHDFYTGLVENTMTYRRENPQENRNDFMSLLIKLMDSGALNFNQIAAQAFVFIVAGYETTSATLTFCLFELSQNESIRRKARNSVREALKKHGDNFTYESIKEMEYLEQCVNEALRKYPPAVSFPRVAKDNYPVPGTSIVLEKGTNVTVPVYGIHHDPSIYPQPEIFDPERFSPEEIDKRHPFAFLPFGAGPRICIGMKLAMMELKVAMAKILLSFEFSIDRTKTSMPMKFAPSKMVLTPLDGIYIDFNKIS